LERRRIETKFPPDRCLIEDRVVDPVPVDQQQDSRVVVTRSSEPASAHIRVVAILGDEQTSYAAENVGERPIAVTADVLGRHDAD
jgi:hypothetical protein